MKSEEKDDLIIEPKDNMVMSFNCFIIACWAEIYKAVKAAESVIKTTPAYCLCLYSWSLRFMYLAYIGRLKQYKQAFSN